MNACIFLTLAVLAANSIIANGISIKEYAIKGRNHDELHGPPQNYAKTLLKGVKDCNQTDKVKINHRKNMRAFADNKSVSDIHSDKSSIVFADNVKKMLSLQKIGAIIMLSTFFVILIAVAVIQKRRVEPQNQDIFQSIPDEYFDYEMNYAAM